MQRDRCPLPRRSARRFSALQRFHGRLSEQTIYLRFFGSLNEFSDEKAQYFANVDGVDHYALVAWTQTIRTRSSRSYATTVARSFSCSFRRGLFCFRRCGMQMAWQSRVAGFGTDLVGDR